MSCCHASRRRARRGACWERLPPPSDRQRCGDVCSPVLSRPSRPSSQPPPGFPPILRRVRLRLLPLSADRSPCPNLLEDQRAGVSFLSSRASPLRYLPPPIQVLTPSSARRIWSWLPRPLL